MLYIVSYSILDVAEISQELNPNEARLNMRFEKSDTLNIS